MDDRDETSPDNHMNRRDALKSLAAAATIPVLAGLPIAEAAAQVPPVVAPPTEAPSVHSGPRGDAWDPDLINPKKDWPRKLNAGELATLAALCDMIIPADAKSPSASSVGAQHYVNEHVSAPFDGNARDLVRVRGGISWLNLESQKRFSHPFAKLSTDQKTQICDDICFVAKAKPEFVGGARFFSLIRNLTGTAFYTSDAGMKDIGYMGNVALAKWDAPPDAVLRKLGLA